ncbi:MAG: hypothetical protein PHV82_10635 [Victivallaceae bacterium]|nr:hypothetical protein [Victivallaceae bacterium]
MPKIKFLIVPALTASAVAVLSAGCFLFDNENSSKAERLAVAKTVAQSLLKLVCAAYQSGGNTLAEAQIDSMAANGKLTETQATALKSMLGSSVTILENLADGSNSTTETTAAANTGN